MRKHQNKKVLYSLDLGAVKATSISVFVLVLVLSLLPTLTLWQETFAANAFPEPDADITTGWGITTGTNYWTEVDDGVQQPTAGTTTDYVGTDVSTDGDGVTLELGLEPVANVQSASQVVVWAYMQNAAVNPGTGDEDTVDINLRVNGTLQTATNVIPVDGSWGWFSATFTGTWNQTDMNNLQAQFVRNVVGGGNPNNRDDDIQLSSVYADVTYTSSAVTQVDHFRWRNDDGSETTATWLAAEDSNAISDVSKGSTVRLRFQVERIGTTDSARTYRLEWADKGGGTCSAASGWTRADTASDAIAIGTSADNGWTLSDGEAASDDLETGSGTHVSGEIVDGDTGDDTADSIGGLAAGEDTEIEYTVEVTTAAANDTTYCFRVTDAGTTIGDPLVYPELTTPPPSPMEITQEEYVWEYDDDSTVDTNTLQDTRNTAITGVKKGERLTLRTHLKNTSGAPGQASDFGLFYDRNDGIWTKVENEPSIVSAGNCTDSNFSCATVDQPATLSGSGTFTSIAFDPSGNPWISYYDSQNQYLWVANYVGSGGSGCGGGSTEWSCTLVDGGILVGQSTSIAFDTSGNPWVSYRDSNLVALKVARFTGTGTETSCSGGSASWDCVVVDDPASATGLGAETSIAFDTSGNPWVSYSGTGTLKVARFTGTGTETSCSGGSADWDCVTVDDPTNSVGRYTSIAFDPSGTPWVSYLDGNGFSLKVAQFTGTGTENSCSGGSADWDCVIVDDPPSNAVGYYTSIDFGPAGSPWVSYHDTTGIFLKVARFTGTGTETSCSGGSADWDCVTVDDPSNSVGEFTSISVDPAGNPLISYADSTAGSLKVARFTGTGTETSCSGGSADWDCVTVDDPSNSVGNHSSNAFDPSGKLWVAYHDNTDNSLQILFTERQAEIINSPALAGENGDAISITRADSTDGGTNCETASTFTNGVYSTAEELIHPGFDDDNCTELAWVIDTSQAQAGETYRFVLATKDNWNPDKGVWRGPVQIDNYPTLTIEASTATRIAKDTTPSFVNCLDTSYGCAVVDDQTDQVGEDTSIAFDAEGNPWISYQNRGDGTCDTSGECHLVVANYVGSDGNCDTYGAGSTGSDAWNCTIVDAQDGVVGEYSSIAIDNQGNPWVSYKDNSINALLVANYVGSGGNCDTYATGSVGSDAWQCTVVDHPDDNVGRWTSIAFDPGGNAWVSYYDPTRDSLRVANYVGSGGNCDTYDTGSAGSDAWSCEIVDDQDDNVGYEKTSLAFDSAGNPWVSHHNLTDGSLIVSNYVGSGGNCDTYATGSVGSDAWNCTVVDDNTADVVGDYSSIAFDENGDAWVSYRNGTNRFLVVAQYVGTGNGDCNTYDTNSSGGSDAWDCTIVDHPDDNIGYYTSIAFDSNGDPWVSYWGATENALRVANFVGSGGDCDTYDTGSVGSDAWDCTIVDNQADDVGRFSSLAFDPSGTPWITYKNNTDFSVLVSKLHLPPNQLTTNDLIAYDRTSAASGDARYRLDGLGYDDVATDDTNLDPMPSVANEKGIYTISNTQSFNTSKPVFFDWVGQSTESMATNNLVTQAYNFTNNAWDTVNTESSCPASTDCSVSLTLSSTDYFSDVGGGESEVQFRVYLDDHTTTQTLSTDLIDVYQPVPPELTIDGYILENADGTTVDTNTQQAAGNIALTGVRKGEVLNARFQVSHNGAGQSSADTEFGLFYDRNDGIWTKVENEPPEYGELSAAEDCQDFTDTGSVGSTIFGCESIIDGDSTFDFYRHSSLAFDPSGTPYILTTDYSEATGGTTGNNLVLATFVGSGGSCVDFTDTGTVGSAAWDCDVIIDGDSTADFYRHSALAFAPDGTPYILTTDYSEATGGTTGNNLVLATFVGSGGSCVDFTDTGTVGSAAWDCEVIIDGDSTLDFYRHSSLAFAPDGTPYILTTDEDEATGGTSGNNLVLATFVGSGGSCVDFTDTGTVGSAAWDCEVIIDGDNANDFLDHSSLAFAPDGTPYILTTDRDEATGTASGNNLVLATFVGGSGGSCVDFTDTGTVGSAAWDCEVIIDGDSIGDFYYHSALAFSPSGTPYILATDRDEATGGTSGANLVLATYVGGSGGSCVDFTDTGTVGSAAWDCEVIIDGDSTFDFRNHSSLAFSPNGTPYILTTDRDEATGTASGNNLVLATFVGGSGGSCVDFTDTGTVGSAAWDCEVIIDGDSTLDFYEHSSLAFSPNGTPYILATDYSEATGGTSGNNLVLAKIERSAEITMSPSPNATNGDAISESHADMTTAGDTANRDDADCIGGGTWNSGFYTNTQIFDGLSLPQGNVTEQCTELSFTIDTSQALENTTYRLILASKDNWNPDKGVWRGPVAIDQYATFTIKEESRLRYSKDNAPKLPSCVDFTDTGGVGSADFGCESIIDGDFTNDFYLHSSLAFNPSGTPYILATDHNEATGGTTGNNLVLATFVGSGGSCVDFTDTGTVGSAAWDCEVIIDGDSFEDFYQHSSLAFDTSGTPYIVTSDYFEATGTATGSNLVLATYVGSGGSCVDFTDTGTVGSAAWDCEVIIDGESANDFRYQSSLAFSSSGAPYILATDYNEATGGTSGNNLVLAAYVGNGGSCVDFTDTGGVGSAAWDCEVIIDGDDTLDFYDHSSLAFHPSGTPYVLTTDYSEATGGTSGSNLVLATFVGSGGSCVDFTDTGTVGSAAWDCEVIIDGDSNADFYGHSSLAFAPDGTPYILTTDVSEATGVTQANNLVLATYIGNGGSCVDFTDTGGVGSAAWDCEVIIDGDDTTDFRYHSSLAFSPDGTPYILITDYDEATGGTTGTNLVLATFVGSGGTCVGFTDFIAGSAAWDCEVIIDGDSTTDFYRNSSLAFSPSGTPYVLTTDRDEATGGTSGSNLVLAKMHLPPSTTDLRYNLSDGRAPRSGPAGLCAAGAGSTGYCGLFESQSTFDVVNTNVGETAMYAGAAAFDGNSQMPTINFIGGSTDLSPSAAGEAGDIYLQTYRFGTINAWETITSLTSGTCSHLAGCNLNGTGQGDTASEYYELINGKYWSYFRVYQIGEAATANNFYVDELDAAVTSQQLRGGSVFEDGVRKPLRTD